MRKQSLPLRWLIHTALAYLGTPYRWGGDDPSGFDCSGFMIECLKTIGLMTEHDDATADDLWRRFQSSQIEMPEPGALLFTLNKSGRATHVVLCLDDYFQIGASGGDSGTTDRVSAWRDNAYVRIRPISFNKAGQRICRLPLLAAHSPQPHTK